MLLTPFGAFIRMEAECVLGGGIAFVVLVAVLTTDLAPSQAPYLAMPPTWDVAMTIFPWAGYVAEK